MMKSDHFGKTTKNSKNSISLIIGGSKKKYPPAIITRLLPPLTYVKGI